MKKLLSKMTTLNNSPSIQVLSGLESSKLKGGRKRKRKGRSRPGGRTVREMY